MHTIAALIPLRSRFTDAQLVLARAYGFESWPKLKAYVDGVTVKRFEEAARNGDFARLRAMLRQRPELVAGASSAPCRPAAR